MEGDWSLFSLLVPSELNVVAHIIIVVIEFCHVFQRKYTQTPASVHFCFEYLIRILFGLSLFFLLFLLGYFWSLLLFFHSAVTPPSLSLSRSLVLCTTFSLLPQSFPFHHASSRIFQFNVNCTSSVLRICILLILSSSFILVSFCRMIIFLLKPFDYHIHMLLFRSCNNISIFHWTIFVNFFFFGFPFLFVVSSRSLVDSLSKPTIAIHLRQTHIQMHIHSVGYPLWWDALVCGWRVLRT